jgi:transcriptional antiterminator RfaH
MVRRPFIDHSTWFCVHTHPGREQFAADHLQAQGYEVFYPVVEIKRHRHSLAIRPLFPRYLFVNVNQFQPWSPIQSTPGVSYILSWHVVENEGTENEVEYNSPASIAASIVNKLRQTVWQEAKGTFARIHEQTRVKVVAGAWWGHQALCTWTNGERARLLFELFGRAVELEFSVDHLEPVNG